MKKNTNSENTNKKEMKSDLWWQAFGNVMQDNVGKLFFRDNSPVLILKIEVINTHYHRLDIQYLQNCKISSCLIEDVEEFYEVLLSKTDFEFKTSLENLTNETNQDP